MTPSSAEDRFKDEAEKIQLKTGCGDCFGLPDWNQVNVIQKALQAAFAEGEKVGYEKGFRDREIPKR